MTRFAHDPYAASDRFPLGAVPAGSVVRLRVRCEREVIKMTLRLWDGARETQIDMQSAESGAFEAAFPVSGAPGLLWYFFIADMPGERAYIGNKASGRAGEFCAEPPSFQITVYDPAFEAPLWMRDSVMMQIMVDRFAVGGAKALPHGRGAYLHADWYDAPHVRTADARGDAEAVDFFGGNLRGIEEKLEYLKHLGVGALYLNPIFRARSNHKYDTGDYKQIDPSFGTDADFARLCDSALQRGVRVVLDGVFSHTGSDSRYFNRYSTYPDVGAYQSPASEWASWFTFKRYPGEYDCWWGIDTLPNVNEMQPSYIDYILTGEDAVISRYLSKGASGWRLDVADELPLPFLRMLRARVKAAGTQNAVIGEVWEDPSYKITYGEARSYALGDTLDSAMNYPLRENLIGFMLGDLDAYTLSDRINRMLSTLPKPMLYSMMNLLGSHDKPRAISVLAGEKNLEPKREERRYVPLTPEAYARGRARFVSLWKCLCFLPGMPCLYYGDEAGLTGMADPICRATYPWGREDARLIEEIARINQDRNQCALLRRGETRVRALNDHAIEIDRYAVDGKDAFGAPISRAPARAFVLDRDAI